MMIGYWKEGFRFYLILLWGAIFCSPAVSLAQDQEFLTICTQNLHMLGRRQPKDKYKKYKQRKEQAKELIERFRSAKCDVVALQEVYGETEKEAKRIMTSFVNRANKELERNYFFYLAKTNDKHIRNGFLVDISRAEVEDFESFYRMVLPAFNRYGPIRRFPRGPAGVLLKDKKTSKKYYVLTYHFKSKVDGWKDLSGLNFELFRIENAEGLRQIVLDKRKQLGESVNLIALGDRNAHSEAASSHVLSGKLRLEDFQGPCMVTKELEPSCQPELSHNGELAAVSEIAHRNRPGQPRVNSYRYKKEVMLYDDIYIRPDQKTNLLPNEIERRFGSEGEYNRGSDHLLIWVRVN